MHSKPMHSAHLLIVAVVVLLSSFVIGIPTARAATAFYVATNGNDANPGTLSAPYRTIQKCASVAQGGDTCSIRAGTYRETVTPANSGTAGAPITFQPYNGESVTVSGDDLVTGGWSVYSGNIYQTTVTLPTSTYNDTGLFANQLFVDSTMMLEARWPNTSLDLVTQRTSATAQSGSDATHVSDSTIPSIAGGWVGGKIYFRISSGYISMSSQITAQSSGQLTLDSSTVNTESGQCPGNCMNSGAAYFLFGKLGALDSANEWYYDGGTNKLYLWAPSGGTPTNVEYKARVNAFDLSNRSYITVRNVAIRAATITTNSASNTITVDGIDAKYVSHFMTVPYNKNLTGTQYGGIYGAHSGDTGIILAGPNNTLKNSTVAWSAGNGVAIASGGSVDNNLIHDINYGALYNSAVAPDSSVAITRNTIYNTGRDGITNFRGNTEIGYNHIFDYGYLTKDLAGVYTCCSVDLTGTRIHHNWVHTPRTSSLGAGLYIDGGSGNALLDHNVVWGTNNGDVALNTLNGENPAGMNRGNNRVYNNTLASGFTLWTNNNNDLIKNNIFRGNNNGGGTFQNNLPSSSNPLFVNASANDYRLSDGSPAINYGQSIAGITDGYVGSAPDAGAYEYSGMNWGPPGCNFTGCAGGASIVPALKNAGFESGSASDWTWTYGGLSIVNSGARTGTYAAKVTGAVAGVGQVVTGLTPNTTYTMNAWARVGTAGESVAIGVKNYGGSDTSINVTTTSYTQAIVSFTTGASSTSAEIYMWKQNGSGEAYADDFSLVTGSPPLAPNLAGNPGFESGSLGEWSTWTSAASVVASNARSGTYAAKVSGAVVGVEQTITGLSPSTTYTLKGWGRVGTNGESVLIGAKDFGGTETNIAITTTSYSEGSVTFTTGATNTSVKIYFYKHTGFGDAFGDDFSLR